MEKANKSKLTKILIAIGGGFGIAVLPAAALGIWVFMPIVQIIVDLSGGYVDQDKLVVVSQIICVIVGTSIIAKYLYKNENSK